MKSSTLFLNIVTGEAWKACDTCGEQIPADGKCHDTKGFPSDPHEGIRRLGEEHARQVNQAVMDVLRNQSPLMDKPIRSNPA